MENNTSSITTASNAKQVGHSNTISLSPESLIRLDKHISNGGLIEELDSLTIFKLANTEVADLQAVLGDNADDVFYAVVQHLVGERTGELPNLHNVIKFNYSQDDYAGNGDWLFLTPQEGAELFESLVAHNTYTDEA